MRIISTALSVIIFTFAANAAQAGTPSLTGSWSGGGVAIQPSGAKDPAKCRLTYRKKSRKSYTIIAKCSTPTLGVISQTASVSQVGKNRFRGSFHNSQYNVSGKISITVRGKRQSVTLSSSQGSAKVTLAKR